MSQPEKVSPNTLYDKLFNRHIVEDLGGGMYIIKIDRLLIHEVTSAIAIDLMRSAGRKPAKGLKILATEDHNIPTTKKDGIFVIKDKGSKNQIEALRANAKEYGFILYSMGDKDQGIVHIIAPEKAFILPGLSMVCGDSHTVTSGALASLSFGVGESEVSIVLQTGVLYQKKLKNMRINMTGKLTEYKSAKDVILYIISKIGNGGGAGYAIEFSGEVFENMSMEERMTVCNMATEAGAKVGIIAADKKTIDYVNGRQFAPKGEDWEKFEKDALENLHSDTDAIFDKEYHFNAKDVNFQITYGTTLNEVANEGDVIEISENAVQLKDYMGYDNKVVINELPITQVFIGSCTNGRLSDFEAVANILIKTGLKKHPSVNRVRLVPGDGIVKKAVEDLGYHKLFIDAGFDWHEPGCDACLNMNNDPIPTDEHCATTSNRNFPGRQGGTIEKGARSHLCSPVMAVLAALHGKFVNPIDILGKVA